MVMIMEGQGGCECVDGLCRWRGDEGMRQGVKGSPMIGLVLVPNEMR